MHCIFTRGEFIVRENVYMREYGPWKAGGLQFEPHHRVNYKYRFAINSKSTTVKVWSQRGLQEVKRNILCCQPLLYKYKCVCVCVTMR